MADTRLEKNKLNKKLRRSVAKAISDFDMIEDGDRVLVCLSGGKDSFTMLDILLSLRDHAPIKFEILAFNLDQKQPGFPERILPEYLKGRNVDFVVLEEDTYSLVVDMVPSGKTYCGWCSRFRRGIIYRYAKENNFSKIALGHHRDDIIETLFLNMFYGGKLKAMPPKLLSDDSENIVIRPLAYCREKDIGRYAEMCEFPIIPCDLCGSQDGLQRATIKKMLQSWDKEHPGRIETIFRATQSLVPSHLLDESKFDFKGLAKTQAKIPLIEADDA